MIEIVVVIVVVGLLAVISIAGYGVLRSNGMDAKLRSIVKTAGDAMVLHESQTKVRLQVQGDFNQANSVDSLVPEFLDKDYRRGVSSKNAAHSDQIFRWYTCNDGSNRIVIYASLNNPRDADRKRFQQIRTDCRHNDTQAPATRSAMSGEVEFNYAQQF